MPAVIYPEKREGATNKHHYPKIFMERDQDSTHDSASNTKCKYSKANRKESGYGGIHDSMGDELIAWDRFEELV